MKGLSSVCAVFNCKELHGAGYRYTLLLYSRGQIEYAVEICKSIQVHSISSCVFVSCHSWYHNSVVKKIWKLLNLWGTLFHKTLNESGNHAYKFSVFWNLYQQLWSVKIMCIWNFPRKAPTKQLLYHKRECMNERWQECICYNHTYNPQMQRYATPEGQWQAESFLFVLTVFDTQLFKPNRTINI